MYGDLIFKVHLHLLPFGKYKIAYLHLLVKRKYKRKSRFFANTAAIQYKGLKNVFVSDQARTPAAPTPPRWNPPPISRGKGKPPTPWGDRQLCQSRKVVRAKVAKSFGIVVSHSRKSRESRSVLRVIVAGRTHHIFEVLLLQVLGGNLISELLVGC